MKKKWAYILWTNNNNKIKKNHSFLLFKKDLHIFLSLLSCAFLKKNLTSRRRAYLISCCLSFLVVMTHLFYLFIYLFFSLFFLISISLTFILQFKKKKQNKKKHLHSCPPRLTHRFRPIFKCARTHTQSHTKIHSQSGCWNSMVSKS